jgi:hypothetical protein
LGRGRNSAAAQAGNGTAQRVLMPAAAHRLEPSMMKSSQQVQCQSVLASITPVGLRHCLAPVLLLAFQISNIAYVKRVDISIFLAQLQAHIQI